MRERLDIALLDACLTDAAALGYRQLAVSGGEPLLYPDLPRLLSRARALGMITTLTTNGTLTTTDRWAPLAPWVDVMAVSIDGTPAEHDAIRRQPGAFRRTVENLAVVRDSGVPFGFIFTLTQHNVDSLESVVRLAASQGARSVQVHPLSLHGRALGGMADARPDDIELAAALAEATHLGATLGVAVQVDALTREQLMLFRDHVVPAAPVRALTVAAPVLIVQADGHVLPFTHDIGSQLWLGSLHAAPLARLADDWLADGRADTLARACDTTWRELTASGAPAVYWYHEVAMRTRLAGGCHNVRQPSRSGRTATAARDAA